MNSRFESWRITPRVGYLLSGIGFGAIFSLAITLQLRQTQLSQQTELAGIQTTLHALKQEASEARTLANSVESKLDHLALLVQREPAVFHSNEKREPFLFPIDQMYRILPGDELIELLREDLDDGPGTDVIEQ